MFGSRGRGKKSEHRDDIVTPAMLNVGEIKCEITGYRLDQNNNKPTSEAQYIVFFPSSGENGSSRPLQLVAVYDNKSGRWRIRTNSLQLVEVCGRDGPRPMWSESSSVLGPDYMTEDNVRAALREWYDSALAAGATPFHHEALPAPDADLFPEKQSVTSAPAPAPVA